MMDTGLLSDEKCSPPQKNYTQTPESHVRRTLDRTQRKGIGEQRKRRVKQTEKGVDRDRLLYLNTDFRF